MHMWRKQWPSETWSSAHRTPIQAIYNDFEMLDIEQDHAAMREKLRKPKEQIGI